jgi:hypothetical protein
MMSVCNTLDRTSFLSYSPEHGIIQVKWGANLSIRFWDILCHHE